MTDRELIRWIKKKSELPLDCDDSKLMGQMRAICFAAQGYDAYIKAFKCEDKQGEISRLTVELAKARAEAHATASVSERSD